MILTGKDDVAGFGKFVKAYVDAGSKCVDLSYDAELTELRKTDLKGES